MAAAETGRIAIPPGASRKTVTLMQRNQGQPEKMGFRHVEHCRSRTPGKYTAGFFGSPLGQDETGSIRSRLTILSSHLSLQVQCITRLSSPGLAISRTRRSDGSNPAARIGHSITVRPESEKYSSRPRSGSPRRREDGKNPCGTGGSCRDIHERWQRRDW